MHIFLMVTEHMMDKQFTSNTRVFTFSKLYLVKQWKKPEAWFFPLQQMIQPGNLAYKDYQIWTLKRYKQSESHVKKREHQKDNGVNILYCHAKKEIKCTLARYTHTNIKQHTLTACEIFRKSISFVRIGIPKTCSRPTLKIVMTSRTLKQIWIN